VPRYQRGAPLSGREWRGSDDEVAAMGLANDVAYGRRSIPAR